MKRSFSSSWLLALGLLACGIAACDDSTAESDAAVSQDVATNLDGAAGAEDAGAGDTVAPQADVAADAAPEVSDPETDVPAQPDAAGDADAPGPETSADTADSADAAVEVGGDTASDAADADAAGPADVADADTAGPGAVPPELAGWCTVNKAEFSFFVTSMNALWALSGDNINDLNGGLGGNFGGLAGADAICQGIAAATGHGDKTWHAYLSVTDGGDGQPVHAIERIGAGPWYDANGRLVASGIEGALAADRPDGEEASVDDLPDECGLPISLLGDAHDVVTGSTKQGKLHSTSLESTCNDWTTSSDSVGSSGGGGGGNSESVMCGHSFPRQSFGGPGGPGGKGGANWLSDHALRGCGKGANLLQNGPGTGTCIGCSGGYGALYCFAL